MNWPSVEVLTFIKDVRNVEISNLKPKKKFFFKANFFDETFHPETAFTNMTFTTYSI